MALVIVLAWRPDLLLVCVGRLVVLLPQCLEYGWHLFYFQKLIAYSERPPQRQRFGPLTRAAMPTSRFGTRSEKSHLCARHCALAGVGGGR